MRARSRARAWALRVLFAWETRGSEPPLDTVAQEFLAEQRIRDAYRPYVRRLLRTVEAHQREIDEALERSLTNWRLARLSVIDRCVLRLAAAEMLFLHDVPPLVSIQEAIVLAEKYGSAESPRFVNGVLDAVMRSATATNGAAADAGERP